jgi:hypothetical protein
VVLPVGEITIDDEVEVVDASTLPTRTYKIDFERGRCSGMVEGLEAIEQSIYKVLLTERFEHLIYSDDYGFENVIGYEELFVRAELPRRIKEALLQDERITSVEEFSLDFKGDEVTVKFTCTTIYGDVEVLREVNSNV